MARPVAVGDRARIERLEGEELVEQSNLGSKPSRFSGLLRHCPYTTPANAWLKRLRDFWERHGDAEKPLRIWYKTARNARWRSLQDIRRAYPHADGVTTRGGKTFTVFNICGNKYRLIARVRYDYELMNVRAVLTHTEYDQGKWKE